MYKITIEQTKNITTKDNKSWVRLGDEEVERKKSFYDMEDKDEPKTRITEITGWSPEIEKTEEVTTEIYKQCVDELDLNKVIIAVNGIK